MPCFCEGWTIRNLRPLLKYLGRHKTILTIGFICLALENVFGLAIPWILKLAIDHLRELITTQALLRYAGLIVGATALQGVFKFLMRRLLIGTSRTIEYELNNDLFSHLQTLSPAYFNRISTGDIVARATNDISNVRLFLGPGIMNLVNTAIVFVAALVLMLKLNARLTLFALAALPILSVVVYRFSGALRRRFRASQEQFARLNSTVQENLTGIRVIKAYNAVRQEIRAFNEQSRDYLRRNMDIVRLWGGLFPAVGLSAGVGAVAVLWLGGRDVILGRMTLGSFVAFNGYLSMLVWPMVALGWVINLIQSGASSMVRIQEILQTRPDIRVIDPPAEIDGLRGDVEFRNVGFRYNGDPVLTDISLRIPAGATVGIVGRTGSGKTSLVNLVPRLFDATDGRVLIDGIEVGRIPLETLRRDVAVVPQEAFVFSTTIRDNIAFGTGSTSEDRIREAARLSAFEKDISQMTDDLRTEVGERGVRLSGGQRQRLSLARALAMESRILILDDAFSAVDAQTETVILERLGPQLSDRTCLLVSNRLSAMRLASFIIVLDQGRIAEMGTHDELIRRKGLYERLHRMQRLEEALEEM